MSVLWANALELSSMVVFLSAAHAIPAAMASATPIPIRLRVECRMKNPSIRPAI
jgi:hypothetical protein